MKKKLPIGIQTFRTIREEGYYYVDKTAWAQRLQAEGTHYFLSRPRRFGKSLFLDTLKELFEGNEELFRGLAIHGDWDWSVRYPVVRLSFGSGNFKKPGSVCTSLMAQLDTAEQKISVELRYDTAPERFGYLIRTLHEHTGQRVVVLVDEYDKPILDALEVPEVARANRDFLRGLYAVIKDSDAHIKFTFLTGVSKFSKVSLFSGLNNLKDITLDPRYSAICGYTDQELDEVFAAELPGLDRQAIRDWYNGYNWLGKESVYNPFDVLLLFDCHEFDSWWFETGSPTFLIDMLVKRGVSPLKLDGMFADKKLLSTFDVDDMATEALLFQTGYLTIKDVDQDEDGTDYRLGYPNREVRLSLNKALLEQLTGRSTHSADAKRLRELLAAGNTDGLEAHLKAFYDNIPYEWHTNTNMARFEGYFASVFYAHFAAALGSATITVEDSSSRGRADLTVRLAERVYIFEFKVVERAGAGAAMAQLRERNYANKYQMLGKSIHLVAVEFSSESRNLVGFKAERA